MTRCATCPDPDAFRELLRGRLPANQTEALAAHLEGCPACTAVVASLEAAGPTAPLRGALDDTGHDAPGLPDLVGQLKGLWAARDENPAGRVAAMAFAPPAAPDELGHLGHYRVRAHLGSGGMGVVFAAHDTRLDRPVAIKFLHPRLSADPQARSRFLGEARATAAVRHARVVTVFEVGGDDTLPYLVMERLEGETLDARLRRETRLPVPEVVRIGREMAEGLSAAHAVGLVHRDVKPGNVWLESATGGVRLLDFGLARPADGDRLTDTGLVVGTPAFMAPEQAASGAGDARSDLFSLGCVLYLLATGELPFPGANSLAVLNSLANTTPTPVRAANPAVPPLLSDLIARLLAKNPDDRPASAARVADELRAIETAVVPTRRKRRAAVYIGLAALAATVVLVAGFVIKITTKDGKTIEVPVPDGAKIEIVASGGDGVARVEVAPPPRPVFPRGSGPDALRREDIPPYELLAAGEGDPARAPPELVAVFGDSRLRHWGATADVAWHPSGDRVATAASEGVAVWDAATGRRRQFIPSNASSNSPKVAYSPDGATFAYLKNVNSATLNGYAHIVLADAATGVVRRTITGHTGGIFEIGFSPDSASLVACDDDGRVRRWAVGTGAEEWSATPLGRFEGAKEQPRLTAARFSPDGRFVAVAGYRTPLRNAKVPGVPADDPTVILDAKTGKTVWEIPRRSWSLAWGEKYLATELAGKVEVWDVPARKSLGAVTPRPNANYNRCAFHPADPDRLVIAGREEWGGGVFEWSVSRKTMLRAERVVGYLGYPNAVAFRSDGKVLAVTEPAGLFLLDTATWKVIPPPGAATYTTVNDLAVTPDGRFAYATGSDFAIRRWDLGHPTGRPETVATHPNVARVLKLSADGKALSVFHLGAPNHRLDLTATPVKVAAVLHPRVTAVSADGSRYVGTLDKTLAVWDAAGRQVGSIPGLGGNPTDTYALSPDGRAVAQVVRFGPVNLFDSATGKRVWEYTGFKDTDWRTTAFSPDGRLLAMPAGTNLLLLDAATGELRHRLTGVGNGAFDSTVAFTPDGKTVAAAWNTGRVRVWDTKTGQLLRDFRGGPFGWGRVRLAFTPDGRHLVTGNPTGTVYVFRLADAR